MSKKKAPNNGNRNKPLSAEGIYKEIRKVLNLQLNTSILSLVQEHGEDELAAMFPEDLSELDQWLDSKLQAALDNEEPTPEEMVDGATAFFTMAFMERVIDHLGLEGDEDEQDSELDDIADGDTDGEDD